MSLHFVSAIKTGAQCVTGSHLHPSYSSSRAIWIVSSLFSRRRRRRRRLRLRRSLHRFLPPDSISEGASQRRTEKEGRMNGDATSKGIIIAGVNLRWKGGTNYKRAHTVAYPPIHCFSRCRFTETSSNSNKARVQCNAS